MLLANLAKTKTKNQSKAKKARRFDRHALTQEVAWTATS